jgi:hypothetical protein
MHMLQKMIVSFVFVSSLLLLLPFAEAHAQSAVTGSGYGGECTISVRPPWGGFDVDVDPVYRNWWEWWSSPKVHLELRGGNAYQMKISNSADFAGASTMPYHSSITWNVPASQVQGWKKIYVKFLSSCGKETNTVSQNYYYWGW